MADYSKQPKLMNTLVKLDFYKKKSIMIAESSTMAEFNTCLPFLKFKFASRPDAQSGGKWDDNNTYWFNGYSNIYNLFASLQSFLSAEAGGDARVFSNPKKGKGISIRKNKADNGAIWYVFTFFIGSKDDADKISVSLTTEEMGSIVGYLKSFMTNYPTIAMQTLIRHDAWWLNTGSKKQQNGGGGGYQNNNNRNSGGGGGKQSYQDNTPDNGMANDINNEFSGGGTIDDVPF